MFSFRTVSFAFAIVIAVINLSYGWYGPDGIRPIRPLGPGGVQPIQPLGPGGIQPIQPLGPEGIRKSTDDECCFRYGFGARMAPCCLSIITCKEHYQLVEDEKSGRGLLGGAHGKHTRCPQSANQAHRILRGQN